MHHCPWTSFSFYIVLIMFWLLASILLILWTCTVHLRYSFIYWPWSCVDIFNNILKLNIDADNGLSVLPDQIWGLYIGWAKYVGQEVLKKAVISIGWSAGDCDSKRIIVSKILYQSAFKIFRLMNLKITCMQSFKAFQRL